MYVEVGREKVVQIFMEARHGHPKYIRDNLAVLADSDGLWAVRTNGDLAMLLVIHKLAIIPELWDFIHNVMGLRYGMAERLYRDMVQLWSFPAPLKEG